MEPSQTYDHDQWGNHAVTSGYIQNPYATPTSTSQYANNRRMGRERRTTRTETSRLCRCAGSRKMEENRLVTSTQPNTGAISYVYDGSERRVQNTVGSAVTTFVYDGMGQLAAEYGGQGAATGTIYLISDPLGSMRLVLDPRGTPNPGRGILLSNGGINAFVNGQWTKAGTYWQTDVVPAGVGMALHAAGVSADAEIKKLTRDVAIGVRAGQVEGVGGTVSLRTDAQGKTFGAALWSLEREVGDNELRGAVCGV